MCGEPQARDATNFSFFNRAHGCDCVSVLRIVFSEDPMNDIHPPALWCRTDVFLALLSLVAVPATRAQEAPLGGARRLTDEQHLSAVQTKPGKLGKALKLFSDGKPVEAIPIVKEIVALERALLKAAESNPVQVELPRRPGSMLSGGFPGTDIGRSQGPFDMLLESARSPTLRDFEAESIDTLELLEQLYETIGDFKAAGEVSATIARAVAKLAGVESWQAARARVDVQRLDRIASMDRIRLGFIDTARKATALVVTDEGPLGTAFCIDPQGLFLTLDEVASPRSAQVTTHLELEGMSQLSGTREQWSRTTLPMTVFLNLGSPDLMRFPVRVLWQDSKSRLVLLKAESREPLTALALAPGGSVAAGKESVALGLPFVSRLRNIVEQPIPTVRARPGRVAIVRERTGKPLLYQLDSTPPPGYSGGPVLDEHGQVIGIIVNGLQNTDIHYVLPVDAASAPLTGAVPDLQPPPLLFSNRHAPVDWTTRLYSSAPLSQDIGVEIRLDNGSGTRATRTYPARPHSGNAYTARVVPVAPEEVDMVVLTLELNPSPIHAVVADRVVRIGETAVRLSELRRIEQGPRPGALTVEGHRLTGPLAGIGTLTANEGRKTFTLDIRQAPVIRLECPAPGVEPVAVEVVVKVGDNVLGRLRKTVSYADSFETPARIDPAMVGGMIRPPLFEAPNVRIAVPLVSKEPTSFTGSRDHSLRSAHHYSTAFSRDGRLYADGGDDNIINVFEASAGKLVRSIKIDAWAQSIDFTPDGRTLLAAAYQERMHLYDVDSGRDLNRFVAAHIPGLDQSVLSPDGRLALSIHAGGKLLLWDVKTGSVTRRPSEASRRFGFCFTPDSQKMLIACQGAAGNVLELCDARGGDVVWTIPSPGGGMPVFVDCEAAGTGRFYAGYENGVVIWGDLADGKVVRRVALPNPIQNGCLALSPDGLKLLAGHPDNALRLWSVPGGELIERIQLESVPTGPPRFSPNGASFIANSFRGRLIFRQAPRPGEPGAPLVYPLPGKIESLAVGGAGRYLLMKLKGQRRLVVFDTARVTVAGEIELADDETRITANAKKGFVAYPRLLTLDRIDLATVQIDRSAAFPCGATPRALLTGSAAAGPLLSIFNAGRVDDSFAAPTIGFIDPDTLGLIAPRLFRQRGDKTQAWAELTAPVLAPSDFAAGTKQGEYRASATGDLFCYVDRSPLLVLAVNNDVVEVFSGPNSGALLPAPAGRSFVAKNGQFDLQGTQIGVTPDPTRTEAVPAMHDAAYHVLVRNSRRSPEPPFLEIYSATSHRRLFVVDGLHEMKGLYSFDRDFSLDQRFHVNPSAGVLVTIPRVREPINLARPTIQTGVDKPPVDHDQLVVRRLDILGELRRLAIDEIVVTSSPIIKAIAGDRLHHRVEAYAKGGAIFERADGPQNLSVSSQGELRWDVPPEDVGREHVAVVTVRSASGQKVSHKVHILVGRGR
jgi:S1-C subfamily serine protease